MKQKFQVRQGDVFLTRITEKIPAGSVKEKPDGGRLILARGEATGHHHSVIEDDAELIREGERMLLNVLRETALQHQEHAEITLDPGLYEVRIQREYSPAEIRRVAD